MRNAKAFRGGATTNAPPFNGADLLKLQNVPVERFGQGNSPVLFVQLVQTKYLFRQSKISANMLISLFGHKKTADAHKVHQPFDNKYVKTVS